MNINNEPQWMPLASKMRPRTLSECVGQQHLLAEGKPLQQAISQGRVHSMILWGPPGSGKTTLAELIAKESGNPVEKLSAVLAGVKEIRDVVANAKLLQSQQRKTGVLFVDEVHRFNKAQQDAFLPHVEQGTLILIGATTENPSFHLNNALLSRTRVYVLEALTTDDLLAVIARALTDKECGLGNRSIDLAMELQFKIAAAADGDARQALNILEMLVDFAEIVQGREVISETAVLSALQHSWRRFDKGGEAFYDQISALHKSIRGSDPDAALYWLIRMLDGGCDPDYIARRIVRAASEDIGNADPRALTLALQAWECYERLGSKEGELALAQAVVYLACAAKSNAVYTAFGRAMQDAKQYGSADVPLHLRNAPTRLMRELDYGKNYRYAHDEPDAFAAGCSYFPEGMPPMHYYQPVERGLEIQIKEKLDRLRQLNQQAKRKK
jgi:putative ATPase